MLVEYSFTNIQKYWVAPPVPGASSRLKTVSWIYLIYVFYLPIESFLIKYIEKLLKEELPKKLTGHPNQPKKPLVRIRVEFEVDSHQLAVGRFGNNFHDRVANPAEMLLFKNVKKRIKTEIGDSITTIKTEATEDVDNHLSIEDIIKETFTINAENDSAMKLLTVSTLVSD